MFLDSRCEDKSSGPNGSKHYRSSVSSWIRFWFVIVLPKYLNCATFSKHLLPVFMSWLCPAFWWRDGNMYLVLHLLIFNWPNPSSRTMALGSTQPLTEIITRNLPGGKGRSARKADNLTAICEPIVQKMWEPRRLTTLWASTARYRHSFTHFTKI
jgi:hypothetical protein